ncbi:PREDICTED: putative uncharacterized protein DDB_G0282133 [Eufriesea mexicana]|uniref:putative uncharacterized protein DDB_G0282133 n=1 Tax=Eufriesea mexicana TaxID=516756 RepID=UPI00083C4C18|nr:PREDICTED: putative uncharacterized protein DDB_G0282133 [Eufriesea mexicana]
MLRYRDFNNINSALTAAVTGENALRLRYDHFFILKCKICLKTNHSTNECHRNQNRFKPSPNRYINFNQFSQKNSIPERKQCRYCKNFGYVIEECKNRQNNNSRQQSNSTNYYQQNRNMKHTYQRNSNSASNYYRIPNSNMNRSQNQIFSDLNTPGTSIANTTARNSPQSSNFFNVVTITKSSDFDSGNADRIQFNETIINSFNTLLVCNDQLCVSFESTNSNIEDKVLKFLIDIGATLSLINASSICDYHLNTNNSTALNGITSDIPIQNIRRNKSS